MESDIITIDDAKHLDPVSFCKTIPPIINILKWLKEERGYTGLNINYAMGTYEYDLCIRLLTRTKPWLESSYKGITKMIPEGWQDNASNSTIPWNEPHNPGSIPGRCIKRSDNVMQIKGENE